jgi:hypothetical protein
MSVSRHEFVHWSVMKEGLAQGVINALHDAGYVIRREGVSGSASVTLTDEANYRTMVRVDADIRAGLVGAAHSVNTYQLDERYAEHLAQMTPRLLADVIAKDLMEPVAVEMMRAFRNRSSASVDERSQSQDRGDGLGPQDARAVLPEEAADARKPLA